MAISTFHVDSRLLKKAIKNLKNSFIDLMKEKEKEKGLINIEDEEGFKGRETKTLAEDLEKQIAILKQELDSRPCIADYKEKVDLIDELNDKLTLSETENLAFKLELNNSKTKIGTLQHELEVSKMSLEPIKIVTQNVLIQTDDIPVFEDVKQMIVSPKLETTPDNKPVGSGVEEVTEVETELKIIHHPDVQREEELVAFKEKYSKLVEEKLEVDKELIKLREDYRQFKNKSLVHLLLYLAPFIALISYLIFYYTK